MLLIFLYLLFILLTTIIYHSLFNHFPVNRHLDNLQHLVIEERTALNIPQHIYLYIYTEFPLGIHLQVKSLDCKVCLCLTSQDNKKNYFPKWLLVKAMYRNTVNLHPFQHLILSGISLHT